MRPAKLSVLDISDLAYNKSSELSKFQTWFNKPIYTHDNVYDILSKTPGLKPTMSRWELLNVKGYTREDLIKICLQAKPKAPKPTLGDVAFTLFTWAFLAGLVFGGAWLIDYLKG